MSTIATSGRSSSTARTSASPSVDGRDDVEPVVAQEPRQAVAQQREILGDHDPHGITARTVVGPPAGLEISSVPSSASTRRARPLSPDPDRIGAADAVVDDLDEHRVAPASHRDVDVLGVGVLAGVRERLGDDEVRGALDGRRPAARRRRPARGRGAASGWRAPRSPPRARGRRARAGGCRAPGRAAPRAPRARPAARPRAARARRRDRMRASARPCRGSCPSATSRACAPSCRSRSMRRSSASCWSTAPARLVSSVGDALGERPVAPGRAEHERGVDAEHDEEHEDRPDRPEVPVAGREQPRCRRGTARRRPRLPRGSRARA